MKILLLAFLATSVQADTPPVPKLFKGMQGQMGQYRVDLPDHSGAPRSLTVCTDNLMKSQAPRQDKRGDPACTYKLLKDTADEAVIESTCNERTNSVTVKRESAKSMLMTIGSSGPKGPQTMKMRYTYLGACREGQGAVTLEKKTR
jgi:hypothetical protein